MKLKKIAVLAATTACAAVFWNTGCSNTPGTNGTSLPNVGGDYWVAAGDGGVGRKQQDGGQTQVPGLNIEPDGGYSVTGPGGGRIPVELVADGGMRILLPDGGKIDPCAEPSPNDPPPPFDWLLDAGFIKPQVALPDGGAPEAPPAPNFVDGPLACGNPSQGAGPGGFPGLGGDPDAGTFNSCPPGTYFGGYLNTGTPVCYGEDFNPCPPGQVAVADPPPRTTITCGLGQPAGVTTCPQHELKLGLARDGSAVCTGIGP